MAEKNKNEVDGFLIVGIGASAGGLDACTAFFEHMRQIAVWRLWLSYICTRNMKAKWPSSFAERLRLQSSRSR